MIEDNDWPLHAIVYAIDDDTSFRQSLLRVLGVAGLHAVGYGSAGDFLIDRVREQPEEGPACILLDIAMPGPSGIELMRAMAAHATAPPIIFVTGRDDVFTSVDMMKCGAVDYLLKPVCIDRILTAVRRALRIDVERRAAQLELSDLHLRFATLSQTERTVFYGVVHHQLNKQMAVQLNVCERTVKTLRSRMMEKLQLATVPGLVRAAKLLEASPPVELSAGRRSAMELGSMQASLRRIECRV
ncbi:MAG: response regulator [Steroidobacteraceae bacterium]